MFHMGRPWNATKTMGSQRQRRHTKDIMQERDTVCNLPQALESLELTDLVSNPDSAIMSRSIHGVPTPVSLSFLICKV